MTSTYPALCGKFGTTRYYVIMMRMSELVDIIQFPADVPDWEDRSIEEKFQRKLDMTRITRDIAPYFASDPRRFSGSLVLAVLDTDNIKFESIHSVVHDGKLPLAYSSTTNNLGFITFNNQKFVPLDGQHRAKAFQMVMDWHRHPETMPMQTVPDDKLGDDQITLILVDFDTSLSRYIFNKINKYAKPTSKAGKLITDDDDAMAVITRRLVEGGTVPKRIVNLESNSLNKDAIEFTLLSTFHDANKSLLSSLPVPNIGKPEKMKNNERDQRQIEIAAEWKRLISGIKEWNDAIKNPEKNGDNNRKTLRAKSILGRPIGQLSLVKGYAYACNAIGQNVNRDLLVKKLNMIDWNINADMWRGMLVKPNGRIMYGTRVSNLAAKFIAHLIGAKLTKTDIERILTFIYGNKRRNKRLPPQIDLQKQ